MDQIHGHEVMEMMLASGRTYTRETLVAEMIERFGVAARFHTCSAQNMTAEELVTLLEARGKLLQCDGGFRTSEDVMCQR